MAEFNIENVLAKFKPNDPSLVIPILQEIQEKFGYIPPPIISRISKYTAASPARIFGVITFYSQFYTEPKGRHTVRACRGTACHVRGARMILNALERNLKLKEGETTPDNRYTLETVACLGACALAPTMVVDKNYYGKMTPERIHGVLEPYK